jgi:glycosyltransferase involved in cell wall biosynthesis
MRQSLSGSEKDFLVGFLGNIKPYKRMEVLTALPKIIPPDGRPVRIVVAGRAELGYETQTSNILRQLDTESLIRIDKILPDEELDELIQACDVVILPYDRASNSGAAMLVLSNHGRLLASDLPIFRELEQALPQPWICTFHSQPCALSQSLLESTTRLAQHEPTPADEEQLENFLKAVSFSVCAGKLKTFYLALTGSPLILSDVSGLQQSGLKNEDSLTS